jgi:predicted DCC family thiol-disulfide oxidoreductase YuxK
LHSRHVAALLLLVLVAWSARWALPTGELRDYGSFVASGQAGAQGLNPYGIYPLTFHVVLPGFDVWNPNLNPPVSVPLFAQFARMDPHTGFGAWWIFSAVCYVLAIVMLAHAYGRGRPVMILWALALAGFWDTLALGQIYLPLVLGTVAGWILLQRGHLATAGILIGVVVAVKPNFGVWPLLLLLAGHSRAAAAAGAAALAVSVIPLLTHGPGIYAQWIELVLSDRGRAAFLTNASLTGLTSRAGVSAAGMVLSGLVLLAMMRWAVRARPDPLRASAIGIAGGILASPIAWVHYTLFLLPAFFVWPLSGALLLAAGLMLVPVPVLLGYLDAPLWQVVTIGSAYNWAVLFALAGFSGATMQSEMRGAHSSRTVLLYDGYCGLCDRLVHFLLRQDSHGRLRFAPLQGSIARRVLRTPEHETADPDTVLVVVDFGSPNQRVLARSRAVLYALSTLGGVWGMFAAAGRLVPVRLADALYRLIARNRYRIFGRYDTCPLPRPEWRERFLDEPISG